MGSLSRTAPGLAARIAADLFMRPLRPKPRPRELEWTRNAAPVTLPTRFGDLAGWSWGEGPVVILLHGWNGRGSQMGLLAQTIAVSGFRAVAFDAPAHGRSPGRRTNLLNLSAALVDVAEGLPDLHGIVGHSFGALAISYRWAELPNLNRLVMVSPPAETKFYSRMFIEAIGANNRVHEAMTEIYERRFDITWDDLTVENLAPELDTPLLVVHDRSDRQAPFSHGERTRDTWARARLHETEQLGHMRILRDEKVAAVITDFMTTEAT
jgi:pimeloyl-ACP methyl ester carboxylesterase